MSLYPWKSQRDGFLDSLRYLKGRKEGTIKSFRTPWKKFNDATIDGLEWNSMTVIAGRPGTFKTGLKDQLVRESFTINHGETFRILEFQFEMHPRVSAIREYSSVLGKSYKHLCSADGILSDEDLVACHEHAKIRVKYPIDVVEDPCTVNDFKKTIIAYMSMHVVNVGGESVYTNTVVTLDHTILMKLDPYEKSKLDMLYNLGAAITDLKRKYPIAFVILSQLNRDIDRPERSEDGKYGNYVLESDIFGSDAMLQHADTVVGLSRPGKQRIRFYGPDRYIIEDNSIIVMHYLKCRNSDTRMSFYKGVFEKMVIEEIPVPPQAERRSKSNKDE